MDINIHAIEFESQKATYKVTTCNTIQFRHTNIWYEKANLRKETWYQ